MLYFTSACFLFHFELNHESLGHSCRPSSTFAELLAYWHTLCSWCEVPGETSRFPGPVYPLKQSPVWCCQADLWTSQNLLLLKSSAAISAFVLLASFRISGFTISWSLLSRLTSASTSPTSSVYFRKSRLLKFFSILISNVVWKASILLKCLRNTKGNNAGKYNNLI